MGSSTFGALEDDPGGVGLDDPPGGGDGGDGSTLVTELVTAVVKVHVLLQLFLAPAVSLSLSQSLIRV